jgi:monofunctional biosynthetic peptidoglycan transglycosylase
MRKTILKYFKRVVFTFLIGSVLGVVWYRFFPVWVTPYLIGEKIRAVTGSKERPALQKKWTPIERIADQMAIAVIASEDQNFLNHYGFDFGELKKVMDSEKKRKRGASTITQQVAKNVFLWHGRSYFRKGLEAWFTILIEVLWPKERILEVYLNVAETGDMCFGVEAAAQRYFKVSSSQLNRSQAARIAAILPNPKVYKADNPGPYVQKRAAWIERQMRNLGGASHVKKKQ